LRRVGSLIGHARVSTVEQLADLQTDELTAAGGLKVFVEQVSGAVDRRPLTTAGRGREQVMRRPSVGQAQPGAGVGHSRRPMTRIPAGQVDRSSRAVGAAAVNLLRMNL